MDKIGMISGARGMDSSFLADLLISKGYKVVAFARRVTTPDNSNIQHLFDNPNYILESGDITDSASVNCLLKKYQPDEFYNCASQSHVHESWNQPVATCEANFMGVLYCLEGIRTISPKTRFLQCSTSETMGKTAEKIQTLDSPLNPQSPYAASKAGAEHLIGVYRNSYNLFCCFARSYNHTGVRRGHNFVERKITRYVADLFVNGYSDKLHLGNLDSRRDFTSSQDIVRGFWMMLNQSEPDNFLFASGKTYSISDILDIAFGIIREDWHKHVLIDPKFVRPAEVSCLCGNYSKAKDLLGWEPSVTFEELINDMVKNDIEKLNKNAFKEIADTY